MIFNKKLIINPSCMPNYGFPKVRQYDGYELPWIPCKLMTDKTSGCYSLLHTGEYRKYKFSVKIYLHALTIPETNDLHELVRAFAELIDGYCVTDQFFAVISFNDPNSIALLLLMDESQLYQSCMKSCYYSDLALSEDHT